MQTYFSIIMPTYNRKHCIKNAVDSLLAQTYKNYELIIIDDGSTDGTDKYLKDIYKEESRKEVIRYIKIPRNNGAAFARNAGLKKARYSWIGYLDTDNRMQEDFLQTFADSIEKNPQFEIHYAQIKQSHSQAIIGHEFNSDELTQFNFIDLGVFVHSANIYKEIGGYDNKLDRLIDWDLIIRYTGKYPPKFIEKVLLDYNDSPESSRITNNISLDEAYKRVILNYYNNIPPQKFIEKYTSNITRFKQTVAEQERALSERDRQIESLYKVIEDHGTQIAGLNKGVASRDSQIAGLNQAVSERDAQIFCLNQVITTRDSQIAGLNQDVTTREGQISGLNHTVSERELQIAGLNQAVLERDVQIADLKQLLVERDAQISRQSQYLETEKILNKQLVLQVQTAILKLDCLTRSRSYKIGRFLTFPLRYIYKSIIKKHS